MDKKKVTYKGILLSIGFLIFIIAYKFFNHFGLIPGGSLLGGFLGLLGIISIALFYRLFIQKEPFSRIIYQIRILLPYLAIPAFVSFLIIAALPFFVSIKSKLFDLIIVLVMIGWAVLSVEIMRRVSRRKGDGEAHKANRGRKGP